MLRSSSKQRLDDLPVPPSPIDDLIDRLGGPDAVAEMTGRGLRVARKNGRYRYEQRFDASRDQDSTTTNLRERAAFQDGKKRIAIISDAASTGVSLHAAIGSKGAQHRRVHVTLELAWSAEKCIQQLGRTHRSHQATAPVYALLATDLGGEARFAAAVAKHHAGGRRPTLDVSRVSGEVLLLDSLSGRTEGFVATVVFRSREEHALSLIHI